MSKQLTMKAGVAMFAALALAGALAIFIFGAYQPVAAQADPSASRSFSPMTVEPGGTVTVTITLANVGGIGRLTEMIPSGFTYVSSSLPAAQVNTDNASAPVFNLFGAGASFTYSVTAPMTTGDYEFSGTLRSGDPPTNYTVGGDTTVTVATEPEESSNAYLSSLSLSAGTLMPAFASNNMEYTASVKNSVDSVTITATPAHANASVTGAGEHSLDVGANTITVTVTAEDGTTMAYTVTVTRAGAMLHPDYKAGTEDVRVTIHANAGRTIGGGRDIDVTLEDFGIPSSIDDSDVILDGGDDSYYGNPADVSVSGDTITITLPTRIAGTSDRAEISGDYTIILKSSAELSNPTSEGGKEITVSDADADDETATVTIVKTVSVKTTFVTRGGDATVTANRYR